MLLDVWMPKMNGLDVLAARPQEGARPRVVVMTSDDTPETLLRAVREQASRYVAKPVEPQALVELLREVLAQTAVAPGLKWCQRDRTRCSVRCIETGYRARAWIGFRGVAEMKVPACTLERPAYLHEGADAHTTKQTDLGAESLDIPRSQRMRGRAK